MHVPYRGAAPAVQDVIGGQVPFMFVDTASGYPHILSGKLRAIGVASPKRVPASTRCRPWPSRGMKGFEAYAWQGLVVPAGHAAGRRGGVEQGPGRGARDHGRQGALPDPRPRGIPSTPAQMAAYAKSEREKWGQVIRAGNIRLD